ncbi:MAG: alpha/beta hydrolase family protein [Chloroflexota bacterium]
MGARVFLAAILLLAGLAASPAAAEAPAPAQPAQPLAGPGGRSAPYAGVRAERVGEPPRGYWLFSPEEAAGPEPGTLRVVLFLHGYTAIDPAAYRGWIDHIVRRGSVVIYPDYQTADPFAVPWAEMLPNAVAATRNALASLGTGSDSGQVAPVDISRMAVVGHSLGGVLAVSLASVARQARLPEIPLLLVVQPGGCEGCGDAPNSAGVAMPDLSRIPDETRLLLMVGEDDGVVADRAARVIWEWTAHIPSGLRDAIVFPTDRHGAPALKADHSLPQTGPVGGVEDAFDWFGPWKMYDLLADCVFAGSGCEEAMNGSPAQRHMGSWSDGTPVRQPLVTDALPPPDQQE